MRRSMTMAIAAGAVIGAAFAPAAAFASPRRHLIPSGSRHCTER